jgi:Vacuolar protein sorting protein 11 C terminal
LQSSADTTPEITPSFNIGRRNHEYDFVRFQLTLAEQINQFGLTQTFGCRKLVEMIRAQEQSKDLHDQFRHQLQCSQDGFSVVADFFGRGIFNKVGQCSCANVNLV